MGGKAGEENQVCSGRNPKMAALSEQEKRKVLGETEGEELFTTATVVWQGLF